MAPFPEEVDVFSGPHSRMKQLVEVYSEKLSLTDFTDYGALESLLHSLHQTFCEFKSHEQIENKYIMKKLKTKLKALQIHDAAVCNCHSDNRLSDMLALVNDGYSCTTKSASERINYGLKLQRALKEFTETFLPHMKEEEEVFQPMLMKYFEYDELKCLKETVIEEHVKWQDSHWGKEKSFDEVPEDSTKILDECDVRTTSQALNFSILPEEVVLHIFSYLNPYDLVNCSEVCHSWNRTAYDPQLWKELYPVHWARGFWNPMEFDPVDDHIRSRLKKVNGCVPVLQLDEDADIDESSDSESSSSGSSSVEDSYEQEDSLRILYHERNVLNCIIKFLLPKIGTGVQKVVLAASKGLTSRMLRSFLLCCPNLLYLDVSYTAISDAAFKGLKDTGCYMESVQHLDFAGCSNLSDLALFRIADCMIQPIPRTSVHGSQASSDVSSDYGNREQVLSSKKHWVVSNDKMAFNYQSCHPNLQNESPCGGCTNFHSIENQVLLPSANLSIARQFLCKNCPLLQDLCDGVYERPMRSNDGCMQRQSERAREKRNVSFQHNSEIKDWRNVEPKRLSTLQYLNISGCSDITDDGIRYFAELDLLQSLNFLDVSGCWNMTGPGLSLIVESSPKLEPCNLYYCDYITDGPYPDESNGCQNLQCAVRLCCCSGK